jgi:hypothetical protein
MITIDYNNNTYVSVNDIIKKAPIYSKGARSAHDLMRKKNISKGNYIYARFINNEWEISNGNSAKFDRIFVISSFLNDIPEINKACDKIIIHNGIEKAPKIIKLIEAEKLKDNKNNIIEIEIRGDRYADKINFKVKDIAKSFNMLRLQDILLDEKKSYQKSIDYKYFYCNYKNKIKKELFITYRGFQKLIETNRAKIFTSFDKDILHKWLNQLFDKNRQLEHFTLNIDDNIIKSYNGYVYCITSSMINYVKIGYWRGNITSLEQRYKTYYGNNLEVFYVYTENAFELEQKCHKYFDKYKLCNELFNKQYNNNYKTYLEENKIIINKNYLDESTDEVLNYENTIKTKNIYIQQLEKQIKILNN